MLKTYFVVSIIPGEAKYTFEEQIVKRKEKLTDLKERKWIIYSIHQRIKLSMTTRNNWQKDIVYS